jgi:hypothetical protein
MKQVENTAKILKKFIGDILNDNDLDSILCANMLEITFGEEIHKQIDGFIIFCEQEGVDDFEIKHTLLHDLGGALNNDKLMLPRVTMYADYSKL